MSEDPTKKKRNGNLTENTDSEEDIYGTPIKSFIRKLDLSTTEKASKTEICSIETNVFFGHCVQILKEIICDHDVEIHSCILDLFLKHQIYNAFGLSLLQLDEIPDENTHSLWGILTFKKTF